MALLYAYYSLTTRTLDPLVLAYASFHQLLWLRYSRADYAALRNTVICTAVLGTTGPHSQRKRIGQKHGMQGMALQNPQSPANLCEVT